MKNLDFSYFWFVVPEESELLFSLRGRCFNLGESASVYSV